MAGTVVPAKFPERECSNKCQFHYLPVTGLREGQLWAVLHLWDEKPFLESNDIIQ